MHYIEDEFLLSNFTSSTDDFPEIMIFQNNIISK